jgi:hypothetical protein
MDRADKIERVSEALRAHLEQRPIVTEDSIKMARIAAGWVGPIAWELAEVAVDALA